MSKITIYDSEPCLIPISYDKNPLSVYGKDYSDIEEVYMGFKVKSSDDDDSIIAKYWKDGSGGGLETGDVLIDETTHTFTMVKTEDDIIPKGGYGLYLGVKVSGLSKMIWLRVKKGDGIIVEQDGVKS